MRRLLLSLLVFLLPVALAGQTLTVIGFNVESGDADPNVIAGEVMRQVDTCDIWGFSKVQNDGWAAIFERAAQRGRY